MDSMVTQATHELSTFSYAVMALMGGVIAIAMLVGFLVPEWRSAAIKAIIFTVIVGFILAFWGPLIDWMSGFNSL